MRISARTVFFHWVDPIVACFQAAFISSLAGLGAVPGILRNHPEARTRFDRVADLVSGFKTPFGLELLSTVHWVIATEQAG